MTKRAECTRRVALGAYCGKPVVPTVGPHGLCSECRIETERAVRKRVHGLRESLLAEEATLVSLAIDSEAYGKEEGHD